MKKSFCVYALVIFFLTACTARTSSPTTATSPREITPADVNLPFDGAAPATIKYLPCYVNTGTRIHNSDVFYFNDFSSDETIHILAPLGGLVMYMDSDPNTIDVIGQLIIVKTDFVYQKETVYYQLAEFHEIASDITVGKRIDQGDTLGYMDNDGHPFDPLNGYILTVAFFVAKPSYYDNDAGNSANIDKYLDPGLLLGDSLAKFPIIFHMPRCEGNPIINP
jgi:murein DD-endopeptidase MepM/ murein hydrolase activator NlpD